ncbi:hypothetical protein [Flavobacterium poyangense]|uniref:hypothetical protein n=1 Tax=Flavobacterium poyangense TaxID=2204302 RepID=UPI001422CFE0|nr:hypothetical protein [Flavobacterium sp. JXAS1]
MKKSFIFFGLLLTLVFCSQNKSNFKLDYDGKVIFYRLNGGQKYSDKTVANQYGASDSLHYKYNYDKLREGDDRLVFFKDSILLNRTKLEFISRKKINGIDIEKYLCDGENSSIHIYLSRKNGLLLTRNRFNNVVVEYYLEPSIDSLPRTIVNDSVFFNVY